MQFALSEEQQMLTDSLKGFLDSKCSLDTMREIASGDEDLLKAFRADLSEMGVLGTVVSETHGGLGLGVLEAALIQEELGAAIAPSMFLGNTLAAIAIEASGQQALIDDVLPGLLSGQAQTSVALNGYVSERDNARVNQVENGLVGTSLFAIGAPDADGVLICDQDGALYYMEVGTNGVSSKRLNTIDKTRSFLEIQMKTMKVTPLDGVKVEHVLAIMRLLIAADTLGAAHDMLDKAVSYAKERQQFGRVIGSFQAVKHMCAEMAAKLEPGRALIWHAAHLLDTDEEEGPVAANLAAAYMAEAGAFIARTATEVHGGMGFTDLLGLHYWYKRIGVNGQLLGGGAAARAEAARLQGWA